MKFGAMEVKVVGVPECEVGRGVVVYRHPHVSIALRACGMQLGAEKIRPDDARQLAGMLVAAANLAEGRAG